MAKPILFSHWRAPGDVVCMTAAIRDLVLQYPGEFEVHVATACPDLWISNPHVEKSWTGRLPSGLKRVPLFAADVQRRAAAVKRHMLTGFHAAVGSGLALTIDVLQPHGDLHLSKVERETPIVESPYWVLFAGGKTGISTKWWPPEHAQVLIDLLAEREIRVVQAGAGSPGHAQPRLRGVIDQLGRTTLRDALRLIAGASGVICSASFAMHAAAAFQRPCVVLTGGREPLWWYAYTNLPSRHFGPRCSDVRDPHSLFHASGDLACYVDAGCWKTQVSQGRSAAGDCLQPIAGISGSYAECMWRLVPAKVARVIVDIEETRRDG